MGFIGDALPTRLALPASQQFEIEQPTWHQIEREKVPLEIHLQFGS